MEYLVKISKKSLILELKRRHLMINVLTSNTSYPSRKIRRIYACTLLKTTKDQGINTSKLLKTLSLDESRSPEFNLFSDLEEYYEEEVVEIMAKTMEQYMSKTRADYGSGIARPKIDDKDSFELKGQFLKELRDNAFSDSNHEDANKHIKKVLEIVHLFHIPNITQDQVMLRAFPMSLTGAAIHWLRYKPSEMQEVIFFYNRLDIPTRQILDSKGDIPSKTDADAKVAIQEMAVYSQKWHNGTSRTRSTKTSDGLAAIQAQLNNLGREIKKVNEKLYAVQVGCEQLENMEGYQDQDMGDIILGEPFCKALCVEARRFDGLITIHNGSDNVTYQMARSHPRTSLQKKSTKFMKYRSSGILNLSIPWAVDGTAWIFLRPRRPMIPLYGDGDLTTIKFIKALMEFFPSPKDTISDICPNGQDISPLNPRRPVPRYGQYSIPSGNEAYICSLIMTVRQGLFPPPFFAHSIDNGLFTYELVIPKLASIPCDPKEEDDSDNVLTKDIGGLKTYEEYKDDWIYEWNEDVTWCMKNYGRIMEYGKNTLLLNIIMNHSHLKIVGNTLRFQDLEWYEALKDGKLKDEALKNKAIMKGIIDEEESNNEVWRRWDDYDYTTNNHEINDYTKTGEEGYELFNDTTHERPFYKIRRFEMIKYSFGEDEKYVAIKEHECDDLMRKNKDA
nr:hypothetical protein [Tanacetum cinerariifolium]